MYDEIFAHYAKTNATSGEEQTEGYVQQIFSLPAFSPVSLASFLVATKMTADYAELDLFIACIWRLSRLDLPTVDHLELYRTIGEAAEFPYDGYEWWWDQEESGLKISFQEMALADQLQLLQSEIARLNTLESGAVEPALKENQSSEIAALFRWLSTNDPDIEALVSNHYYWNRESTLPAEDWLVLHNVVARLTQ